VDVLVVDVSSGAASAEFARSMHETGFAVLLNHGIDDELIESIYAEWLGFFRTPAKHSYGAVPGAQDGYFSHLSEQGSGRDVKEYFQVRPSGSYPTEVSEAALEYFRRAEALAVTLLGWLDARTPRPVVEALSMPLSTMLRGSSGSVLRIQHYAPVPDDGPRGPLRALEHTDLNLLTVLPAPTGPGLQVRDVHARWHDVRYRAGSIVINGGEMLELATRGHYPATPHRVVNPTGSDDRGSRLSLPLFLHPAPATRLADGWTASSFLRHRVNQLRDQGWRPAPGGEPAQPSG
jgi:isopenicillin N synthase-like dioxygenase